MEPGACREGHDPGLRAGGALKVTVLAELTVIGNEYGRGIDELFVNERYKIASAVVAEVRNFVSSSCVILCFL